MDTTTEALDAAIARLTRECTGLDVPAGAEPWRALAEAMSDISEDHVCAGWEGGLEYRLWAMVIGEGTREFGFGNVAPSKLLPLAIAAKNLGGWVAWLGDGEAFVPMVKWAKMYEREAAKWRR